MSTHQKMKYLKKNLNIRRKIDHFWENTFINLSPKMRGSATIHFGRKTAEKYCNFIYIIIYLN